MTSVELRYALPHSYGRIPVHDDSTARTEDARAIVELLAVDDPGAATEMVNALVALGGQLRDSGAIEAGEVTLADQPPDVSATLVLSVHEVPAPDSALPTSSYVEQLAAEIQQRQPFSAVHTHTFSCGPAVVLDRAGTFAVPGTAEVESRGRQVILPTPDRDEMVVLDVSTAHVEHWSEFAAVTDAVADTIHFAKP